MEMVGGKGVLIVMRGRNRMTLDRRIPTMPGRSVSGFYRPGRHCLHQARGAVRGSRNRMKGELHPAKNRLSGGLRHLVRTFLHVGDSVEWLFLFEGG